MAYLDYSPPHVPDLAKPIRSFGDALSRAMDRRRQRQQQEEQLAFQREQEQRRYAQQEAQTAYQNRIVDARERREELDFNFRQDERQAQAAERARKAASPQEAEAILAASRRYDPKTGRELGRGKLEAGPLPNVGEAPTAPVAPEMPPEVQQGIVGALRGIPGMSGAANAFSGPPEIAARRRGQARLPDINLADAPAGDPGALEGQMAQFKNQPSREGMVFVDRIEDGGTAVIIPHGSDSPVNVKAQPGWAEGQWVRLEPEVEGPVPSAAELRHSEIKRMADDPRTDIDIEETLSSAETERQRQQAARDRQFAAPPQIIQTDEVSGDRATAALNEFMGKRAQFETESASFPQRQAAHEANVRRAEATRPYTMSFGPGQPSMTFDFQTQRFAGANAAAEQFLSNLPDNMSPAQQAAARETYSAIKSGVDPQKAQAEFSRRLRLGVEQEFKSGENVLDRQNRIDVVAERNKRPQVSPMVAIARGNLALSAEKQGNEQFQAFLRNQGYKADVAAMKDLIDSSNALKVGNSMLDIGAGAAVARKANGSGVLTNQDMTRFWDAIGGVGARPENWFESVISGEMGEEKRRIVIEGVIHKVDAEQKRLANMAIQADKKFAGEPWYPGTRAAYFDFLPGLPDMGEAQGPRIGTSGVPRKAKGAPPEIKAKDKAKKASLREAMQ